MKGKVNVYLHLISSLETPVYVSNFMVITIAGFNWIKNGKKMQHCGDVGAQKTKHIYMH